MADMKNRFLSVGAVALLVLFPCAADAAEAVVRAFAAADRINWSADLRNFDWNTKEARAFGWGVAEFDLDIPATGWYELVFEENAPSPLEVAVDGELRIPRSARSEKYKLGGAVCRKSGNLLLGKGRRTLRIEHLRNQINLAGTSTNEFRRATPSRIHLIPSAGEPERSVAVAKRGHDVVRLGEKVRLAVTASGADLELLVADLADAKAVPQPVAAVSFGAEPETKEIAFALPHEGVFRVTARTKGAAKPLPGASFPPQDFAAVDVKGARDVVAAERLVLEVDCAALTLNGEPLGTNGFFEVNGPTRVVTTAAGTYRETHDASNPALTFAERSAPENMSSMAYHLTLPAAQVPYRIEVTYPDDTQRNAAVVPIWLDAPNGDIFRDKGLVGRSYYNNSYGKAYRTGGPNRPGDRMEALDLVVWAPSVHLMLPIIAQETGTRAAAARIRVFRFDGDRLPYTGGRYDGGRLVGQWSEEGANWRLFVNTEQNCVPLVHTFRGYERWAQFIRYHKANVMGGFATSYGGVNWKSRALARLAVCDGVDEARLAALICEKYGIYYIMDVFRATEYYGSTAIPAAAERLEDAWDFDAFGSTALGTAGSRPGLNPLHPAVQDFWLRVFGEIRDLVGDSPAFRGVTVRTMSWFFSSDFVFAGLNRGYGDWNVERFARGLKGAEKTLEVGSGDPGRFARRYDRLSQGELRQKWLDWRAQGIADYWRRLITALNGDSRSDIAMVIGATGDFKTQEGVPLPEDVVDRATECGLPPSVLATVDRAGWCGPLLAEVDPAVLRTFRYPCGYASPSLGLREIQKTFPIVRMGAFKAGGQTKSTNLSTVFIPPGRMSLRRLAQSLALADARFYLYGSNSDHYGDLRLWRDFLGKLTALPDERFDDVAGLDGRVAVRQLVKGGRTFVYAVNATEDSYDVTVKTSAGDRFFRLRAFGLETFELEGGRAVSAAATPSPERPRGPFVKMLRDVQRPHWTVDFKCRAVDVRSADGAAELEIDVPSEGAWDLEVGLTTTDDRAVYAELDGRPLAPAMADAPGIPDTAVYAGLVLTPGVKRLRLRSEAAFSVYAYRLTAKLRAIPARLWCVAGPFAYCTPTNTVGMHWTMVNTMRYKASYGRAYLPVDRVDFSATYDSNGLANPVKWRRLGLPSNRQTDYSVLQMSAAVGSASVANVNYAAVEIEAERDIKVAVSIGADWDAFVYLDGRRVASDRVLRDPADPDFGWWRYIPIGTLDLRKGTNLLVVKQHNGQFGGALAGWIADVPGVTVREVMTCAGAEHPKNRHVR